MVIGGCIGPIVYIAIDRWPPVTDPPWDFYLKAKVLGGILLGAIAGAAVELLLRPDATTSEE
jgi:hypothetical protein